MYRKKIFFWVPIVSLCFLVSCGSGDDLQIIFPLPNVLEKSPNDTAPGIALNASIIITFDQDIDPSSLTDSTFFLTGPSGLVLGKITYPDPESAEFSAKLQPNENLDKEKNYIVTVTSGIRSVHGVALGNPHSWSFTTGNQADTEAPDFNGLLEKPKIKNSVTITLSWKAATDNLDQSDQIVYEICYTYSISELCSQFFEEPLPSFFDGLTEKKTSVTNPGVTSFDVTGLFPGVHYFFVVRARDLTRNIDENSEEQSAIIDITPGRLYVSNAGASEIRVFDNPTALNGNTKADAIIRTQSGTIGNPTGLFVDENNDRMYVANFLANSVAVYENLSTLPSTGGYPSRIISGTSTTINGPSALYVDLNDTLYVANINTNAISVFHNASQISGNVVPDFTISGDLTLLDNPLGLVADTTQIYVANVNTASILIFLKSTLQNGPNNSPPDREISSTTLSAPIGLALYSSYLIVGNLGNNSIYLFDQTDISSCTLGTSCSLAQFKTIIGDETGLNEPRGIITSGTRLYVSNGGNNLILVYDLAELLGSSDTEVNLSPSAQQGSPDILGPRGLGLANDLLYVANLDGNSIAAFNANLPSTTVLKIESIQWTLDNPLGTYLDSSGNTLYVTNFSGGSVMVFENPDKIGNNYVPARIISGPRTGLTVLDPNALKLAGPAGIFVDENKDKLYVANLHLADLTQNRILVFDNASTLRGNVAPSTVIGGFLSNITSPIALFVDSDKGILYVLNRGNYFFINPIQPSILIIDLTDPASLARIISGPDTGLSEPVGMTVDLTNDLMYVANRDRDLSFSGGNILVFDNISTTLGGSVAPKRTITFGTSVNLSPTTPANFIPIRPNGIAVHNLSTTQNRVYFANEGTVPSIFPSNEKPKIPPSIFIFEDEITGSSIQVEPSGIIQIGNTPDFSQKFPNQPFGIAVDRNSGTIHVADFRTSSLFIFSNLGPLPSGQTAAPIPSAEIPLEMRGPRWLALDPDSDELFVSSYDSNSILSFRNASQIKEDSTIPLRVIRGKNSKIKQPQGILLVRNQDTDRLYVANEATRSILVFDDVRSAQGDTPPTFEIKSEAFNSLVTPSELRGLAFSQKHDLLYVADKTGKIDIFENVSQLSASSDTSDLTPILTLTDSTIDQPIGLYVQEVGLLDIEKKDKPLLVGKNRLYVSDFGSSMVLVFDLEVTNTVDGTGTIISQSAFRTIRSDLQAQFSPVGIFLHEGLDHLYVSSIPTVENNEEVGENSILVFDKASVSDGIVTPAQHIVGNKTGFQAPFGIIVTSVEFLPDLEKTQVLANPSMVAADGLEESIITVTAVDANNNPFPGISIGFASDRGATDTIAQPTTLTDSNGQVTGRVSSSTPGEVTIQVTVSNPTQAGLARLENTATVTFLEIQPNGN